MAHPAPLRIAILALVTIGGCREAAAPSETAAPDASVNGPSQPGPTPPPGTSFEQIAFVSYRDGNAEIYRIFTNGAGLKRLTFNPAADRNPTWSPNGQKLAFVRSDQIYVMNQNGSGQVNLSNSTAKDADPVWSPDGQKILFRRYFTSNWLPVGSWEVFVMNADGSGQTNLSKNALTYDGDGCWSPDGSQIVFVSARDGNREIYRMDATGGNQTRLTIDSSEDANPQWRPTGDRIAFLRIGQYDTYNLYLMNPDGSNQVEPNPGLEVRFGIVWSPDGTRLAAEDEEYGVHVLTAQGTSLYFVGGADTHFPPVSWSPDSRSFAVAVDPGGMYLNYNDIFVFSEAEMKAQSEGTNVTASPDADYEPAWRP